MELLRTAAYPDWEMIYADNVSRIYALMYRKVGNRPDAEDLTSQVFLTALRPLGADRSIAEVRGYLTATARTVLAEHWRRTLGVAVTAIDDDIPDFCDSDEPGLNERAQAEVDDILSSLPDRQRQILTLRFLRGYSIRDAAEALEVTVANAKVLQHRALRAAATVGRRAAS